MVPLILGNYHLVTQVVAAEAAWTRAWQEMSSRTFSAAAVVEGGGAAFVGIP